MVSSWTCANFSSQPMVFVKRETSLKHQLVKRSLLFISFLLLEPIFTSKRLWLTDDSPRIARMLHPTTKLINLLYLPSYCPWFLKKNPAAAKELVIYPILYGCYHISQVLPKRFFASKAWFHVFSQLLVVIPAIGHPRYFFHSFKCFFTKKRGRQWSWMS